MMSVQQSLVFLVVLLVLSISDVSGFSIVNRKSHRVTTSTRLGMVTGYRGKPASSKQDDLEKTVYLILKHDEKMNSSSSSSKFSRKSTAMSTAEPINGNKEESKANAEEGKVEKVSKLKRLGRALKFWKK